MTILMQIGIAYPTELSEGIGHVAGTLGGVNYECRGGRGCLTGSGARGATNRLFRHQFFLALTDAQAHEAKKYADSCLGQPYVWNNVPNKNHGGDCSGYMSGIICAARGQDIERLFCTGNWKTEGPRLGFKPGLGGGVIRAASAGMDEVAPAGVADRPYPGFIVEEGSRKPGHVRWIQARLNFAAHNKHPVLDGKALRLDGIFGRRTFKVVEAFQSSHGLHVDGQVGPKTWSKINAIR